MSNLLAIISKYPAQGNVKTRLGEVIGMQQAADIAKAMLFDLIYNHLHQSYDLSLETNDLIHFPSAKRLVPFIPVREVAGELLRGPKSMLLDIFTYNLKNYQKVIAVCADTPMVGKKIIEGAFRSLDSYDVVIGPDLGPGYYLIGMKEVHDLFTPINEGTDKRRPYYQETLEIIKRLGLKHKLIKERIDVDCMEDLSVVKWFTQEGDWHRTINQLRKLNLL